MATSYKISDLLSVRSMGLAKKEQIEAVKSEPVMFAIVKRSVGKPAVDRRQLYLATLKPIDVYAEAALVHAFPLAVSSDRVAIDQVGAATKAELAKRTGMNGRHWYWLSNVDGMSPEEAKKLGEMAKSICLNSVLYLNAATAQMLEEMTSAPDDGDIPTRKVVIRDAEAEVEVEAEELFLG